MSTRRRIHQKILLLLVSTGVTFFLATVSFRLTEVAGVIPTGILLGLVSSIASITGGLLLRDVFYMTISTTTLEAIEGSTGPVSSYSNALSKVDGVLEVLGLFLPSRIMKEDAGDAREVINKLVEQRSSLWMIYTKLAFSVFWILLAAVREVLTVTKKKPN